LWVFQRQGTDDSPGQRFWRTAKKHRKKPFAALRNLAFLVGRNAKNAPPHTFYRAPKLGAHFSQGGTAALFFDQTGSRGFVVFFPDLHVSLKKRVKKTRKKRTAKKHRKKRSH
jgi:hypothetical protein